MKFNVGDRVVLLLKDLSDVPAGTLGVVTQVHPNQRFAYGVLFDNNEHARGLHEFELGLPTEGENVSTQLFKGDEVIVTSKHDERTTIYGKVIDAIVGGSIRVIVGSSVFVFYPSAWNFEKVIPPLKFGPGAVIRYGNQLRFRNPKGVWFTENGYLVGNDGPYTNPNPEYDITVLYAGEGVE